jgi:hypothetical protein
MEPDQRPIGWWLKHLDRLIDGAFDDALAESGLSRRQWQILNLAVNEPPTRRALTDALAPFWEQADAELDEQLSALRERGLVELGADSRWSTTAAGTAAHTDAGERVGAIRGRMADGVSADEYRTTLGVLARMAANLEPSPRP